MRKIEFDVLYRLFETGKYSESEYSAVLWKNNDEISRAYDSLCVEGYVSENSVSDKGKELLDKHRVRNAVILAAGMSTRFVPLNYEKPKGLLKVKGEVLVERQIRQLIEKGIREIYIVVGYMKEQFSYLEDLYQVKLIDAPDYREKNNFASVYAARNVLGNTIITSSDLYFSDNIFQTYAFDSYYCTVYAPGKTAERGIETDEDDYIIDTFYGDRCYDIWVTLGYAFFSEKFSQAMVNIIANEIDEPMSAGKFWADIQDEHLTELGMYAKRCDSDVIFEFDTLEELREFDESYRKEASSTLLKKIKYLLGVEERELYGFESMRKFKASMFRFKCKDDEYICDVAPEKNEMISFQGRVYYECRDVESETLKLYIMDKNIYFREKKPVDTEKELKDLLEYANEFRAYHRRSLPLCAAENVISPFANVPLTNGYQERYIMNNTYSFNMEDNFIGCEKLFPFYQKISEVCERIFGAKYTDPRPFTGMHCIDMITKTVCKPGEKMMILNKEHGGHASVQPVVERLGIEVVKAPYDLEKNDLDYEKVNRQIREQDIQYILLAPSDLIKPLDVEQIDTTNCVLLWDCSQLMGLIAAGLCSNPLKTMHNIIMFGGTHKTFPGPASGLIMTNEKKYHDMMEKMINPTYLRHSQMHQKISLLFSLIEFERFGTDYMSHMVHCSNYLGSKLREYGMNVVDIDGCISKTHQVHILTSQKEMDTIYDNAYRCEVTLNKKVKELFHGYGIRLGTQEIARYNWNEDALDLVARIISMLRVENIDVAEVKSLMAQLPPKKLHYCFPDEVVNQFL